MTSEGFPRNISGATAPCPEEVSVRKSDENLVKVYNKTAYFENVSKTLIKPWQNEKHFFKKRETTTFFVKKCVNHQNSWKSHDFYISF